MRLPFLAFLLASFIGGGVNGVLIRFVSTEFGPISGSFLRFLGATLVLLPFWLAKKEFVKREDIVKFFPFGINAVLFSIAILHTSVIMANILYALVPLWVAFLGYKLLEEKLSGKHILGLFVSLFGIGILIKGSIKTADILTFGEPLGNILVLAGVTLWGFWLVGARSLSKKYSSVTILFFTFLTTSVIIIPLLPFEWSIKPFSLLNVGNKGIVSLLGVIAFSSILLYLVYQWLIKNTSAFIGSLIQYGSIVFAGFAGIIVFHERLTVELVLGAACVVAGVFLATTYTQLKKGG